MLAFRQSVLPLPRASRHGFGLARALVLGAAWWLALLPPAGAQPAFPGAQGFGAAATGGRGGQVLRVTTLAASGVGSLQWALDQPGPRIIVFRVSGVIEGEIEIPHGDVTIAGQTAPGAGITINGRLVGAYDPGLSNIIVRHVRARPDLDAAEPDQLDAIQFGRGHTIILDHVDASHGVDENLDIYEARNVTVQWSAITFPVYGGGHPDGPEHNYGLINGPDGHHVSIHHNLFVHNRARTPAIATGPADVYDNVVYNGREGFVHHNPAAGDFNIVANTYIDGPGATLLPLWFDPENEPSTPLTSRYWVSANWVEDPGDFNGILDNPFTTPGFDSEYDFYCCGIASSQFNQVGEFDFTANPGYVPILEDPAAAAYAAVLARAGAWPRDAVTLRAVQETVDRNGTWGNHRPADWLEGLTPGTSPVDADQDGMADAWESAHGLDPGNGSDHSTVTPSGYTAIEDYINGLADDLVGAPIFADGFESGDASEWSATPP